MKNFSVPGFGYLRKESCLDVLKGFFLIVAFSWLFYDSFYAIPFLLPMLVLWCRECQSFRRQKEEEQFQKSFREWILLLSSSLSAGYSVENAMVQSCEELSMMVSGEDVMVKELKVMLAMLENQQSPETILKEFADRQSSEEVKSFVEVFCTARKSGGSLNAIIRSTSSQMAEIMDTRREILTLLASKIYEQKIMTVMPAAVLLYVRIGSGEFLEGLYHNPAGIVVASVCLLLYLGAYLLGKRMVQFEI